MILNWRTSILLPVSSLNLTMVCSAPIMLLPDVFAYAATSVSVAGLVLIPAGGSRKNLGNHFAK